MPLSELFKSVPLNSFRPKTKELIKSTRLLLLCNLKNDQIPPELFHLIVESLFYLYTRELDIEFWFENSLIYDNIGGWIGEYTIGRIEGAEMQICLTPPHTISCRTRTHAISPIVEGNEFFEYKRGVVLARDWHAMRLWGIYVDSLWSFINELEFEEKTSYYYKYYSDRKLELTLHNLTFDLVCTCFKDEYASDIIFSFLQLKPTIFYMKKRLKIVAELKEVLQKLKKRKLYQQ